MPGSAVALMVVAVGSAVAYSALSVATPWPSCRLSVRATPHGPVAAPHPPPAWPPCPNRCLASCRGPSPLSPPARRSCALTQQVRCMARCARPRGPVAGSAACAQCGTAPLLPPFGSVYVCSSNQQDPMKARTPPKRPREVQFRCPCPQPFAPGHTAHSLNLKTSRPVPVLCRRQHQPHSLPLHTFL